MASSILHRASAIICYAGLIKVAIGMALLTFCGKLPLEGIIFSPLGAIGLFVFLWAFIFMALAQLRHAIWDQGAMLKPALNNTLSIAMIAVSVIAAAILTLIAAGVL